MAVKKYPIRGVLAARVVCLVAGHKWPRAIGALQAADTTRGRDWFPCGWGTCARCGLRWDAGSHLSPKRIVWLTEWSGRAAFLEQDGTPYKWYTEGRARFKRRPDSGHYYRPLQRPRNMLDGPNVWTVARIPGNEYIRG